MIHRTFARRSGAAAVAVAAGFLFALPAAADAQRAPGGRGSSNIQVLGHIPTGGPFHANDIEIEQELSRPYVYLSRRSTYGFHIISIEDPENPEIIYSWEIENPALHDGKALDPKYFKVDDRYYLVLSYQFRQGGADADLGAIVFDVTGLPDVSQVEEVGRIRAPDTPGGFHNIFMYKHSDGRALLFTTTAGPYANVYDMGQFLDGADDYGLIGQVPTPPSSYGGSGYHDFFIGYDPATRQDKFYGAGAGGYHVYDVTQPENPELLFSLAGISGVTSGHTFTPTPDGAFAVTEVEYQYAPLRIFDLRPGQNGETEVIRRPIGAWTANWENLSHNHEVRWPYVFVSAYEDGLQVFNMMDPSNPYTVAYFDTYDGPHLIDKSNPLEPVTGLGGGGITNGSFGVDVRNADGLIVTGDMYTGFWIFRMDGFEGWSGESWGMPDVSSAQDWDDGPVEATERSVTLRR